jgi:hypothetical protein
LLLQVSLSLWIILKISEPLELQGALQILSNQFHRWTPLPVAQLWQKVSLLEQPIRVCALVNTSQHFRGHRSSGGG